MSHFQMKLLICVNIVDLIDFVGLSYLKKETVIEGGLHLFHNSVSGHCLYTILYLYFLTLPLNTGIFFLLILKLQI